MPRLIFGCSSAANRRAYSGQANVRPFVSMCSSVSGIDSFSCEISLKRLSPRSVGSPPVIVRYGGCGRYQAYQFKISLRQRLDIVPILRRLRAHQAITVAPLGDKQMMMQLVGPVE